MGIAARLAEMAVRNDKCVVCNRLSGLPLEDREAVERELRKDIYDPSRVNFTDLSHMLAEEGIVTDRRSLSAHAKGCVWESQIS